MKVFQNENRTDRILRFILAMAAALAALRTHGAARMAWLVVVVVALISSLSGFSLFYQIIGVATNKGGKR